MMIERKPIVIRNMSVGAAIVWNVDGTASAS